MSFHLTAYYQSQAVTALTSVNAVQDPVLTTSGLDIRVPKGMANLLAGYALINDASLTRAQIQSPSLRATLNIDIEPLMQALVPGNRPAGLELWESPAPLMEQESVEFFVQANQAVAFVSYGVIVFGDGAVKPVTGKIYTVRATAAAALSAGVWVNSNLTFSQVLPAGHYQVVGARCVSANGVAFRLVFVGGTWRPGLPCHNTIVQDYKEGYRFGHKGVWGEFDNTTPPTIDVLGVTDTSQTVYLDLIKTS